MFHCSRRTVVPGSVEGGVGSGAGGGSGVGAGWGTGAGSGAGVTGAGGAGFTVNGVTTGGAVSAGGICGAGADTLPVVTCTFSNVAVTRSPVSGLTTTSPAWIVDAIGTSSLPT